MCACQRQPLNLAPLSPTCRFRSPTGDKPCPLHRGNLLISYISPSTWGNQQRARSHYHLSHMKKISGAVSGDFEVQQNTGPITAKFMALLPGTPIYKIGELHTTFYLCFLVLLVYLSVFTFVSLIKNTKNTCCYYGFQ